jgi:hypothetical protein
VTEECDKARRRPSAIVKDFGRVSAEILHDLAYMTCLRTRSIARGLTASVASIS